MIERACAAHAAVRGDAMDAWEREDTAQYKVVKNHEDQYSIWLAHRPEPLGWEATGKVGSKQECLAYVAEVWTDMRPRSLRLEMDGGDA